MAEAMAMNTEANMGRTKEEALPYIPCCMCGTVIRANPANMCVDCVRSRIDITEGISKEVTMYQCRGCLKYLRPPWVAADHESAELLAICLKKIGGLNKVKLVDAGWIWTEPHSKRLKVKLTVQKEVLSGAILQQSFIVTFIIKPQQCDECQAQYCSGNWKAVVQVRQKVDHKRTFFFLEQLILKHKAHEKSNNIESYPDGIDLFFVERSHAMRFTDFLSECVPVRTKTAKKLISSDIHNNTYNFKFTFSAEIAPICKDDLVVLPTKLANQLGTMANLVVVYQVSSSIHVIDPFTLQRGDIDGDKYWRYNFSALASLKAMTEFVVLDVEKVDQTAGRRVPHQHQRFQLVEVEIAREADFGVNDTRFRVVTHLGKVLRVGDSVLGYDLTTLCCTEANLGPLAGKELPDIVLVRKKFKNKHRRKHRNWKLKNIENVNEAVPKKKGEVEKEEMDYEGFLNDLEEDKEMRAQINMYKDHKFVKSRAPEPEAENSEEEDDDEAPAVGLEELLDDLALEREESVLVQQFQ